MKIISQSWKTGVITDLENGKLVEVTTGEPIVKKFLVSLLADRNIPFKVYNMGCGVAKITTDTDTCPCCGKPLAEKPVKLAIRKGGG